MFKLPSDMVALFNAGQWPSGFIPVGRLTEVAPFLDGFRIEFVDTMANILNGSGGVFGPIRPLSGRENDAAAWHHQKMGRSSVEHVADLPWLDVDKALAFGGGDMGDELFIVLDYRTGESAPRIIANKLAAGGWPALDWIELAPSFHQFWSLLERPKTEARALPLPVLKRSGWLRRKLPFFRD